MRNTPSHQTAYGKLRLNPLAQALEWEKSQGGGGGLAADIAEQNAHDISSVAGESVQVDAAQVAGEAPPEAASMEVAVGSAVPSAATAAESAGLATETASAASVAIAAIEVPTSSSVNPGAAMATEGATHGRAQSAGVQEEEERSGGKGAGSYGGDKYDDDGDDGDDDEDGSQDREEDEAMEARLRQAAVELSSPAVIRRVGEKLKGYRLPPDRVEELRETLKGFLGTKNYHNYTNHKQHSDPSCKRWAYVRLRCDWRPCAPCACLWRRLLALPVIDDSFMLA